MDIKVCFFLFFCFEMIQFGNSNLSEEDIKEIKETISSLINVLPIRNYGNKGKSLNPYFREVFITNDRGSTYNSVFSVKIYTYNLTDSKKQPTMYKLNCFNICMNCNFAIWIKHFLYNSFKHLPWFNRNEILNNKSTNKFLKPIEYIETSRFKYLDDLIDRFISILLTLINLDPLIVLSNETTVLQTLFILKIKIYYITLLNENNNTELNNGDTVIRESFFVINTLQSFIILNCGEEMSLSKEPTKDKQVLFGYTINFKYLTNLIAPFLKAVRYFNLETQRYNCSAEQMLLLNLQKSETDLSYEIKNVMIATDDETINHMIDFITRVQKSHDAVEMYRDLNSILNAIIKIIHRKIKMFLLGKDNKITNDTILCFQHLKNKFKPEKFPKDLLNYFGRFAVELRPDTYPSSVIEIIETTYYEKFRKVKLSESSPNSHLSKFIDEIVEYEEDFACFNQFFEFLKSKIDRQLIPFSIGAGKRIVQPSNNVQQNFIVRCNFIEIMYTACLRLAFDIHDAGNLYLRSRFNILSMVCMHFDRLKKYFLKTTEGHINDKNILRISYNAAIILVNLNCSEMGLHVDNYERPVYFIMTELNDFGLKYCNTDGRGYMLYNNIDFNVVDNSDLIKNNISKLLGVSVKTLDVLPNHEHFSLKHLYTNFISKSIVIKKYNSVIKFRWKGETKTIEEIYIHATSLITLNPQFLYEFYNVFFLFYIAAFYYEIEKFFNDLITNKKGDKNVFDESVDSFSEIYFPTKFQKFIKKIKNVALSLKIDKSQNKNTFSKSLDDETIKSYFLIEPKTNIFDTNMLSWLKPANKIAYNINSINNELSEIVKKVSTLYSSLHLPVS